MVRLHEQLKYFVSMKISTDSLWQNVKVILSGHETPGEGEHKIMDFIRYEKSKPDYNPNFVANGTYICTDHFPPGQNCDWKVNPYLEPFPAHPKFNQGE